ncbi:hypothetical protein F2P81_025878 [Scophthalmus maximus]|uniref:Integrase catalytic domain-containing protein n=1 Tax=Scophthalmus maximus TaxID=52904 RepID=A0A6A4RNM0_SCOMX|nr:hypothetical protein F2P81_025878 [Scophthalmus maximus]
MSDKRVMKRVYYDPSHPGSLGGVERLCRALKDETGERVDKARIKDFLSEEDTYTLHEPARIHFPRNRVFVPRPLNQFQADLCDMQALSEYNDGFNYLLTVIDVFAKKAYVRSLRKKTGTEVTRVFDSIFEDSGTPEKLQTDAGKEFFNKTFQNMLKKRGVIHFATGSDLKASVVERFNRTLKTRMWRYFMAKNTRRYLDVLQDLVHGYNHSYHKSIKMAPMQVECTVENTLQVFQNLYGAVPVRYSEKLKMNFKPGDVVRISKVRGVFDKKYEQSFTEELFTVHECVPRVPPVYRLKDYDGEPIEGAFYEAELQKVNVAPDKIYAVERVLDERVVRGEKQKLVKWRNWPEKFNSWVTADNLMNV